MVMKLTAPKIVIKFSNRRKFEILLTGQSGSPGLSGRDSVVEISGT